MHVCACVWVFVCARVCLCVCVCVQANTKDRLCSKARPHKEAVSRATRQLRQLVAVYIYIYTLYIYIYIECSFLIDDRTLNIYI